jgi:hypothetical protein
MVPASPEERAVSVTIPNPDMDVTRITRHSAIVGTVLWIAWQWWAEPFPPAALFALSPLVLFPLLLRPLIEHEPSPLLRGLVWAQLPCALLLPVAVQMQPGAVATIAVLPWLGWTLLLAVEAARRLVALVRVEGVRALVRSAELAVIAGLGFPVIGSGWLVLDRLNVQPFDFSPLIVLLTAVHFHHAGFTLPLAAGYLARVHPREPALRVAALTIVAGVPLVAIGITWSPAIELIGAWLTAGAAIVVAIAMLLRTRVVPLVPALLFAISGASLLAGMVFAASYALSEWQGVPWPDIMAMVDLHGAVNALGFGLLGAWAWHLSPPPDHHPVQSSSRS